MFQAIDRPAAASASPEASAPPFLATLAPSTVQRRAAAAILTALLLLTASSLPWLHTQLAPLRVLVPAYQAVMALLALLTGWLLLAQARILRSRALLVLSASYAFSAAMALLLALSFPGLRAGGGSWLLLGHAQTTAWLYFLWHGGFALGIGGYALTAQAGTSAGGPALPGAAAVLAWSLGGAAALGCVAFATVGAAWVAPLMSGDSDLPAKTWAALGAFATGLLMLGLLAWRRGTRTVLDLWLQLTLAAWALAVLLAGVLNHSRFDLGWYLGRVCSLAADLTMLLVLLLENNVLYARLADQHRREHAWNRQRLQDSEQRFRAVFDHATVAISVHDAATGALLQANARALQTCGGDVDLAMAPAQGPRPFACAAPAAPIRAAAGAPSRIEWRSQRSDGSDYWEEVLLTPVVLDGHPRVLAVASDVTERKELQRQILEVSTAEQERIGREVHDGIGQQLTALTMLAGALQRRLRVAGHEPEAEALGQLQVHLQSTLEQARALARGLAPVDIDRHDLPEALRELAGRVRESTGLDCDYAGLRQIELPRAAQARHLFRIAQEGVANALRHADARRLQIRLDALDHAIVLQVLDDGRGVQAPGARRGRLGLHIMAYRADALGARLYVRRRAAGGTEVRCELPLPEPACPEGEEEDQAEAQAQPPRSGGCAAPDA